MHKFYFFSVYQIPNEAISIFFIFFSAVTLALFKKVLKIADTTKEFLFVCKCQQKGLQVTSFIDKIPKHCQRAHLVAGSPSHRIKLTSLWSHFCIICKNNYFLHLTLTKWWLCGSVCAGLCFHPPIGSQAFLWVKYDSGTHFLSGNGGVKESR